MIQQKIKGFLKPNARKVILFILLCIAISASIFIIADNYSGPKPYIMDLYVNFVLLPFYLDKLFVQGFLGIISPMLSVSINLFILFIDVLLTIIWWYIISCSIIFIVNKINKKNVNLKSNQ